MRTIYFRTMLAGLAVLAIATGAAAQDRATVLTNIEVKRLVADATPTDHARLRDHFGALANEYAAHARRYRAMAQTMTGNPNHPPAVPPGARWTRRAERSAASAAVLRELSAHHDRLAVGMPSQAPRDSARFESGEGAPAPTDAQVRELVISARTPADHRRLEEYFSTRAETYSTAARKHAAMAQTYRINADRRFGNVGLAAHCDRIAKQSRESARASRAEAAEQKQLATIG